MSSDNWNSFSGWNKPGIIEVEDDVGLFTVIFICQKKCLCCRSHYRRVLLARQQPFLYFVDRLQENYAALDVSSSYEDGVPT